MLNNSSFNQDIEDDSIKLFNTYLGFHLDKDSQEYLFSILKNINLSGDVEMIKNPHLTLDYFGNIHLDTLNELVFGTKLFTYIVVKSIPDFGSVGELKHFKSDINNEDIFYLTITDYKEIFEHYKKQGYTIREPHITIVKGKNLSSELIHETLAKLNNIIDLNRLKLDPRNIFGHGKIKNGEKIVKRYPVFRN